MVRRFFGRGNKPQAPSSKSGSQPHDLTLADVGDELAIRGLTEGYDPAFQHVERRDNFVIEQLNRYESDSDEWYELIGASGDRRLWLEWADEGELFITATTDRTPMGLGSVGLTESELSRMDEEHSIDNSFTHDSRRYFYKNSQEVEFFQDDEEDGDGFYLWDFVSEDRSRMLSVVKFEGKPFEVFKSEIVPPGNITVYKRDDPE